MADAPATTPKPIKKWAYPFKGKGDAAATPPKPVEVTDPQAYFAALAAAADGFYPVGANGLWHGGIHFDGLTAGTLDQDAGVRCIADGEVIAYRIDSAYPNVEYPSGGKATYSKGFVLVKHRLQLPPKPKATAKAADGTATPAKTDATPVAEEPALTFFSLYMHLLDWAGYAAKKDLARPAFWADATKFVVGKKAVDADPYTQPAPAGKGINVRQAGKGSAQQIGWLPPGTKLTVEAGTAHWRKIASLDSGQMAADPTNVAAVDAPLGWVYTKELNPAPAEPKAKDTIVVLDTPIATDAGALLGYLGQYGRYTDRSALAVARTLVHVEVFSGEDVQGFIDKSKARGKELDAKQKTLLVVDKDSTLVLPTEADQSVAAGVGVKLTDDSPKAGHWAKVQSLASTPAPTKKNPNAVTLTPTGEAVWVERTLLNDKGQRASTSLALKAWSQFPLQAANATGPTAHYLRVAAIKTLKTTAADDKSVRWWEIDVDTPDAKGNTRGWACETGHLQSSWEWPGFEIISETAQLADLHGKQLTDERLESAEDKDDLNAKAERAKEGELFQKLYDVIDVDKKDGLTTDELRAALKKPWLAQTLSRVIARYESEWGGEMTKWDTLDGHMGESVDDWVKEKGRIKDLQWWNELKGKHGFPGSATAFHFHPVGFVENFGSTCPQECIVEKYEVETTKGTFFMSKKALDDMLSDESYKEKPYVPAASSTSSGVTVGYGYDLGQQTASQIRSDLGPYYSADDLDKLVATAGLKSESAVNGLPDVANITISEPDALKLAFDLKKAYAKKTVGIYPEVLNLHPHCQGSLLSLVFNRGEHKLRTASRIEMGQIQDALKNGTAETIPALIRSMKRVWEGKNLGGLITRREREATLFEEGLKCDCWE